MDPNTALDNVREAVGELRQQDDDGVLDGTSQVGFLLESFEALDEWLTKGGFLPVAWGRRAVPGVGNTGCIGETDDSGRMHWRLRQPHAHEYQGQRLVHEHPHDEPHGYFEHPEDVGAPVEPGYDTDVPYTHLER